MNNISKVISLRKTAYEICCGKSVESAKRAKKKAEKL